MRKHIFTVLWVFQVLSLNGVSPDKKGTMRYFRNFDFNGKSRIVAVDGQNIVLEYRLAYHRKPAGAHDGDSGTILYLKITAPDKIETGKTYPLNSSIFEARVAAWGSPAYYQVLPNLKGEIKVLGYQRYHSLEIELDICYGIKPVETFKERIRFENNDFWKKIPGKIDWQSFDTTSFRKAKEIQIGDITGVWRAIDMQRESNGHTMAMLDKEAQLDQIMEIQLRKLWRFKGSEEFEFALTENRLKLRPKQDKHQRHITGIINHITADALIISWIETWKYDGKDFESASRIFYRRTQQP
jgi:hypothetical protein